MLFFTFVFLFSATTFAGSGLLTKPVVNSWKHEIYVSPSGSDFNNVLGDADHPLRTFDSVFALAKKKTLGLAGNQYCVVFVAKGYYQPSKPIEQLESDYSLNNNGSRILHISFIGMDDSVIIDGGLINRKGGYGLLQLCGSNIAISRLILRNAPSFGLMLGQPFARSTNVHISHVTVDSSFSHGIMIGDVRSQFEDTVLVEHCTFRETNRMNAGASSPQWGSALKLYGAKHVIIDSCHFEHNWSEAISINDSKKVTVSTSTFLNNYAASVYCDIAEYVTIARNMFVSTNDASMFKEGKRGMVSILISNEAWSPTAIDHVSSNIDIYSNVHINQGGVLDIWEGAVSFLQRGIISDIRYACNSSFGMSSGNKSTNAGIISSVFSTPFPFNRVLENIEVYGNILSVDPKKWPAMYWVRGTEFTVSKHKFNNNRWNSVFPTLGVFADDDLAIMPDTFLFSMIGLNSLKKKIPFREFAPLDFFGKKRSPDSTFAGAFEISETMSVDVDDAINSSFLFRMFTQERVELPQHWNAQHILCIDIKGRVSELKIDPDGSIRLPSMGTYLLIPKR